MYFHQRKWKAVNVGFEVCVLVVEAPSFSLHGPAYPSAPTGPLTGTGCFWTGF